MYIHIFYFIFIHNRNVNISKLPIDYSSQALLSVKGVLIHLYKCVSTAILRTLMLQKWWRQHVHSLACLLSGFQCYFQSCVYFNFLTQLQKCLKQRFTSCSLHSASVDAFSKCRRSCSTGRINLSKIVFYQHTQPSLNLPKISQKSRMVSA